MNIYSILLLESSWEPSLCLVISISLWVAEVPYLFPIHRYLLPQIYVYTHTYIYIYTFYQLSTDLWYSRLRFRKGNFGIIWFPQISPIPLIKKLSLKPRAGLALGNAHPERFPWLKVRCLLFMLGYSAHSATVLLRDLEQVIYMLQP